MMKMLYTFLERTAFPLDLDSLEREGPWFRVWTKVGIVLTVLDWVGGGLHGEPGGSMQVPEGGEHHLLLWGVCGHTPTFGMLVLSKWRWKTIVMMSPLCKLLWSKLCCAATDWRPFPVHEAGNRELKY